MPGLRLLFSVFLLCLMFASAPDHQAQQGGTQPGNIEVVGVIETIGDQQLVVNGLTVDISGLDPALVGELVVGMEVRLIGTISGGVIQVSTLEILSEAVSPAVIDVEALLSIDNGGTWLDADTTPGIEVPDGTAMLFRLVVSNPGRVDLSNLVLLNSEYDTSGCQLPAVLVIGGQFDCVLGPFTVSAGQHSHTTTALGSTETDQAGETDVVNYYSGDRPEIDVENYVSTDGASWNDADSAPGLKVTVGEAVFFRLTVTNTGNVALRGISLSGSTPELAACSIPDLLEAQASFECLSGATTATTGWHNETTSVTATGQATTVSDTDRAIYYAGDEVEDSPVIVVIEGPVTSINVNIITIFDIEIEIDLNNPILLDLEIGDVVAIEGEMVNQGDTVVIVVVNITIINVVIINIPNVPGIPANCKWTGKGNGNLRLKCTGKGKKN